MFPHRADLKQIGNTSIRSNHPSNDNRPRPLKRHQLPEERAQKRHSHTEQRRHQHTRIIPRKRPSSNQMHAQERRRWLSSRSSDQPRRR